MASWENKFIRISESDDWIVDYDRERGMYRVSYFEDHNFVDEHWFDAYEEKECIITNAVARIFPEYVNWNVGDTANVLDTLENLPEEQWDLLRNIARDIFETCVDKYGI